MPSPLQPTRNPLPDRLMGLVCLLVPFLLFAPALHVGFLSDDLDVVQRVGVEGNFHQGGFFRPTLDLVTYPIHRLFGTSPVAQRAFNLLLHGLCALLLYKLVRGIDPGRQEVAWMAALLFLFHPYHGEAVIWLVGRSTSMAALFMLGGLLALLPVHSLRYALWASSTCWFLALLSYESALLFPLLALPLLLRREPKPVALLPFALAWTAVFGIYFTLRWIRLDEVVNAYGSSFLHHAPQDYLMNAIHAFARLFLPPGPLHRPWIVLLLLALITGAVLLAMRKREQDPIIARRPLIVLGWMLFVSLITPAFVGVSTETSEGDRAIYVPSLFLCGAIAVLLGHVPRPRHRTLVFVTLLGMEYFLLFKLQENWITASNTADRIAEGIAAHQAEGTTYMVLVPEEHDGAFIYRHGLANALLLRGMHDHRVLHASRLTRSALLHAPDTIRPLREVDRVLLDPGVILRPMTSIGPTLTTPQGVWALREKDRVLYWDRYDVRVLWPDAQEPVFMQRVEQ